MKAVVADLRLVLTLILISLLLLGLDLINLLYYPRLALETVTVPIQVGVYQSSKLVSRQLESIFTARFAAQENRALRSQLAELIMEKSALQRKTRELQAMLDQQESFDLQTFDLIPARPIGSGRYLIIDKGSDYNLAPGQVVLFKDHYIGTTRFVSSKTSQVMLASDPDSKVAVFSQNRSGRARGIIQGQFGSEMLMDKILHQEPVEVGDLVYSEGLEGKLPRGLVVGQVAEVYLKENEIFKSAKVKAVLESSNLDLVYIMDGR